MADPNVNIDPEVSGSTAGAASFYTRVGAGVVTDYLAIGQIELALLAPDASMLESARHLASGVGLTAITAVLFTSARQIGKRS